MPTQIQFEQWKKRLIAAYPELSENEDCENCGGDGTVECCECHNEYDCPDCDGAGYVRVIDHVGIGLYLEIEQWERLALDGHAPGRHPFDVFLAKWKPVESILSASYVELMIGGVQNEHHNND